MPRPISTQFDMSKSDAIKVARSLLKKERIPFKRMISASAKKEKSIWIILFERKPPPGVKWVLPGEIIINVDDRTAQAEIFRSL